MVCVGISVRASFSLAIGGCGSLCWGWSTIRLKVGAIFGARDIFTRIVIRTLCSSNSCCQVGWNCTHSPFNSPHAFRCRCGRISFPYGRFSVFCRFTRLSDEFLDGLLVSSLGLESDSSLLALQALYLDFIVNEVAIHTSEALTWSTCSSLIFLTSKLLLWAPVLNIDGESLRW